MENNLFNNDEIYSKSGDEADIAFGTTYLEEQNSIKNAKIGMVKHVLIMGVNYLNLELKTS